MSIDNLSLDIPIHHIFHTDNALGDEDGGDMVDKLAGMVGGLGYAAALVGMVDDSVDMAALMDIADDLVDTVALVDIADDPVYAVALVNVMGDLVYAVALVDVTGDPTYAVVSVTSMGIEQVYEKLLHHLVAAHSNIGYSYLQTFQTLLFIL